MPNVALVLVAAAVLEARGQPSTYGSRRPGRHVPTIVDQVVSFTLGEHPDQVEIVDCEAGIAPDRRALAPSLRVIRHIAASRVVSSSRCARMAGVTVLGMGIVKGSRMESRKERQVVSSMTDFRAQGTLSAHESVRQGYGPIMSATPYTNEDEWPLIDSLDQVQRSI
jgi:hypothetical protein